MLFGLGCQTPDTTNTASVPIHTLAGNPKLQIEHISRFYSGRQEAFLKKLPYSGYVILRGVLDRRDSVDVRSVHESYPNHARDEWAIALGEQVSLSVTDVGTRVRPLVEVIVIFYDEDGDADLSAGSALVFGRQLREPTPSETYRPEGYLHLHSPYFLQVYGYEREDLATEPVKQIESTAAPSTAE